MFVSEFEGEIYSIDDFRLHVGAAYYEKGIYPHCPDCGAQLTLRNDEALPHDPQSLFPKASKIVTAHFSHFPGQADPECRFVNTNQDKRETALSTHIERNKNEQAKARRQFVTEDGRVTQASYWAGFMMARMIGRGQLREDYQFFNDASRMLTTGLIPPSSSKLWRRKAPGWARPFTWLLFHDFPMISKKGHLYEVQFRVDVPENSIMDAHGKWHGEPAALIKVFKNSGDVMTDPVTKQPARYQVTEEYAYELAKQAIHWGRNRPFAHVPPEKLHAYSLFPKASVASS